MKIPIVEKIVVHEADKSNGEREHQVDIFMNFIGVFTPPKDETPPTAEELEEQEKRHRRLEYQRDANKRWYEKKRLEAE